MVGGKDGTVYIFHREAIKTVIMPHRVYMWGWD